MRKAVNIHATCVRVEASGKAFGAPRDAGILLLGDSGSGKSDLALRLIARGAELVADDRVDLAVVRRRLVARAPKAIAGFIEVRGLGIVEIPYAVDVRVALVARLVAKPVERLPRHDAYAPPRALALPLAARPPMIRIAAFEASAPEKLIAAAAAFEHRLFRDTVKPR